MAFSGNREVNSFLKPYKKGVCGLKEQYRKLIVLYCTMFKIGCFTFGGGWSIIAQIEEEFCKKRGWVTEEQILDFMSVAKSLPGIMIVNYSVLFGYTAAGIPGALAGSFGLVSPAGIVIAVITNFYDIFCNNPYVIRMMNGVRSAVIPVIIGAAWKLKKNALTDRATYLIGIAVTVICVVSDLNKLAIVVLCGLIGIAIYVKERTGRGRDLS